MSLTLTDVEKIAHLARLALTPEQKTLYQGQLSAVLAYADKLSQLDLDNVPATTTAVPQDAPLREDKIGTSLTIGAVLANSAHTADRQFMIPAVLDEPST